MYNQMRYWDEFSRLLAFTEQNLRLNLAFMTGVNLPTQADKAQKAS